MLTLSNIQRALSGLTPRRLVKLWRLPSKKCCPFPGVLPYHVCGTLDSARRAFSIVHRRPISRRQRTDNLPRRQYVDPGKQFGQRVGLARKKAGEIQRPTPATSCRIVKRSGSCRGRTQRDFFRSASRKNQNGLLPKNSSRADASGRSRGTASLRPPCSDGTGRDTRRALKCATLHGAGKEVCWKSNEAAWSH